MIRKIEDYIETRGVPVAVLTAFTLILAPILGVLGVTLNIESLLWITPLVLATLFYALWVATRRDLDRTRATKERLDIALRAIRTSFFNDHQKSLLQSYWGESIRVMANGNTQQQVTKTFLIDERPVHFLYFKVGGTKLLKSDKKKFTVEARMGNSDLVCHVGEWQDVDDENEMSTVWVYLPFPVSNQEVTITLVFEWPRMLPGLTPKGSGIEGFWWQADTPMPAEGMLVEFELTFDKSLGISSPLTFTPSLFESNLDQKSVNNDWVVSGRELIRVRNTRIGFQLSRR